MKTKYDFYADAGHGWMKVEKEELERLGIAGEISCCSYMKGEHAYLEEDDDLTTFFEAKLLKDGIEIKFRDHNSEQSKIRRYPMYWHELQRR